jgi:hypothetical protein
VGIRPFSRYGPTLRGSAPLVRFFSQADLSLGFPVGAGAVANSPQIECSGFRRYQLKIYQSGGTGPSDFIVTDPGFGATFGGFFWQNVTVAAVPAGTVTIIDWGEGTIQMPNFMGPMFFVQVVNNGPDAANYLIELWMQT